MMTFREQIILVRSTGSATAREVYGEIPGRFFESLLVNCTALLKKVRKI